MVISLDLGSVYFRFSPRNQFSLEFADDGVVIADCVRPESAVFKVEQVDSSIERADLSHLSSDQASQVRDLVEAYPDVFTSKLGRTNILQYEISLKDSSPVRLPPYRLSPPRMCILREKIQKWLDEGVIRPSVSPYSSPIFLVPKGDNDFRPVVDYRQLNQKIDIESVPLPDINTAFNWFAGAKVFTSLDLNSAYNQIGLAESSRSITAFATDWNLYEFCSLPFGLATGSQVLSRLLDKIFGDIKFKYLYHYLDDLIIYSSSFEEHLIHLREVLARLRNAGLTVKLSKVKFATERVSFLGCILSPDGVMIDPERVQGIKSFPPPRDVKGVARFIGMCNFFRKFVPNFAGLAAPINNLRKKGVPFVWTKECEDAFQSLKIAISSPPCLAVPDFNKRFILQTDASGTAVASVLLQEYSEGRRPVAYASRVLSPAEKKMSVYELEALAVLVALEKFRLYLEHREFDLETDNQALAWVLARPRKTGRLARWAVRISAFKFVPHHIRGTQNLVADALSRMFNEGFPSDEVVRDSVDLLPVLLDAPLAFSSVLSYQESDPELSGILLRLRAGESVVPYVLKNDVLCCPARHHAGLKIVLPPVLIPMVFQYYHASPVGGHLGIYKTLQKIRGSYIWKGMDADIKARIKACHVRALSKPAQNQRWGLLASQVASAPMEKLFIDFVGKLPRSRYGNAYALVCVDAFSKFSWIFPVREATSNSVITSLKQIFCSFGVCKYVVSDNASQFVSRAFKQFCFRLGIVHVTTTPHYPNPSHAERVNRNLKSALIAYHHSDHAAWDTCLFWLQQAFNFARHESHGQTPFEVMFGHKPRCPLSNLWDLDTLLPDVSVPGDLAQVWERARKNLLRAHGRVRARYNRDRAPFNAKVGDKVWVRNFPISKGINKFAAKLAPRFLGPFEITRFLTPVTLELWNSTARRLMRVHVSQVKSV